MRQMWKPLVLAAAVLMAGTAQRADAAAMRAGFNADGSLAPNDDGSTGLVGFGFANPINLFGTMYNGAFLNNNGNMTFGAPDGTYTPSGLTTPGQLPRIAPFFADVDTRSFPSSDLLRWGSGVVGGHAAFGVTWDGVGYYSFHTTPLDHFQVILIDRSDIAVGDFDIEFNYDSIGWDRGDVSPEPAHVGYTDGSGDPGTNYEFAGSGVNGAFYDSGPAGTSLIHNTNVGLDGRYLFTVRSGVVAPAVPEPATMTMLGIGVAGLFGYRLRRKGA